MWHLGILKYPGNAPRLVMPRNGSTNLIPIPCHTSHTVSIKMSPHCAISSQRRLYVGQMSSFSRAADSLSLQKAHAPEICEVALELPDLAVGLMPSGVLGCLPSITVANADSISLGSRVPAGPTRVLALPGLRADAALPSLDV
eukprot:gene3885-13950_t